MYLDINYDLLFMYYLHNSIKLHFCFKHLVRWKTGWRYQ